MSNELETILHAKASKYRSVRFARVFGAGAARQAGYFLCADKEEYPKKTAPPHRPCGLPSVFRVNRASA